MFMYMIGFHLPPPQPINPLPQGLLQIATLCSTFVRLVFMPINSIYECVRLAYARVQCDVVVWTQSPFIAGESISELIHVAFLDLKIFFSL